MSNEQTSRFFFIIVLKLGLLVCSQYKELTSSHKLPDLLIYYLELESMTPVEFH